MFEDYIQDSFSFFELAESVGSDERKAKMFYRASVFCAASSIEAFVNFIGDTLQKGSTFDKNEIAFLNDQSLEVSPSKAIVEAKMKFNSIENKIKFILKKFNTSIDPATSVEWTNFLKFKDFRNSLIHSRNLEDEISLVDYNSKIKKGLNANIDIMNSISKKVFSKPLRRNLVDLKL